MTRTSAPIVLVILALTAATPGAQNRTDFSGTWTLDAAGSTAVGGGRGAGGGNPTGGQGGGLGLGPAPTEVKIAQSATTLTIAETRGTTTNRIELVLDGSASPNVMPAGRSAGVRMSSKSIWKDGTLVTTYSLSPQVGSTEVVKYQEVRSIDRSGAMIVETTLVGQPNLRRNVYKKTMPAA